MAQLESSYTPLNGSEIREIIRQRFLDIIEKIPYLREGLAFKQAEIKLHFTMSVYPADCPVPTALWQELIGLNEGEDAEFNKDKDKLKLLEDKRNQTLDNVNRINDFLNKHRPIEEITDIVKDGGAPDEVRQQFGLPIPMIQTSRGGMKSEVRVNPQTIKGV